MVENLALAVLGYWMSQGIYWWWCHSGGCLRGKILTSHNLIQEMQEPKRSLIEGINNMPTSLFEESIINLQWEEMKDEFGVERLHWALKYIQEKMEYNLQGCRHAWKHRKQIVERQSQQARKESCRSYFIVHWKPTKGCTPIGSRVWFVL